MEPLLSFWQCLCVVVILSLSPQDDPVLSLHREVSKRSEDGHVQFQVRRERFFAPCRWNGHVGATAQWLPRASIIQPQDRHTGKTRMENCNLITRASPIPHLVGTPLLHSVDHDQSRHDHHLWPSWSSGNPLQ
ncbi:hypothetical protein OH76DRAFT_873329 [Lentinus brumalis]|uniref:Uncharacterized protein n=1 Tax=Lentinus brumalis TaxID=2498619 RepID=A0A371DRS7_9APHY|nr:hypothetical protein OH76DRAFT_873329 [Polyporus brumalis]